jgi:hypothetical protein
VVQGDPTFDAAAVSSGGGHSPPHRLDRPTRSRSSRRRRPTGDDPVHPRPPSARSAVRTKVSGWDAGRLACRNQTTPAQVSPARKSPRRPARCHSRSASRPREANRASLRPADASSRVPGPEQDQPDPTQGHDCHHAIRDDRPEAQPRRTHTSETGAEVGQLGPGARGAGSTMISAPIQPFMMAPASTLLRCADGAPPSAATVATPRCQRRRRRAGCRGRGRCRG